MFTLLFFSPTTKMLLVDIHLDTARGLCLGCYPGAIVDGGLTLISSPKFYKKWKKGLANCTLTLLLPVHQTWQAYGQGCGRREGKCNCIKPIYTSKTTLCRLPSVSFPLANTVLPTHFPEKRSATALGSSLPVLWKPPRQALMFRKTKKRTVEGFAP